MAERRMFAKTIIDSDAFLDMAPSTQNLYFHLSMRADDDGFINNPKKIMRMVSASQDELKMLLAKKFILGFESGVIVIKHWKIHNYIQKDRYKKTHYQDELSELSTKDNNVYTLDTSCIQNGDSGKVRLELGKASIDINVELIKSIIDYLNQKANKKYRYTDSNKKHIKARLKEGFVIDDFKAVIDNKISTWLNDVEMSKYVRPETLFGTKFESYLNESVSTIKKDNTYDGMQEI